MEKKIVNTVDENVYTTKDGVKLVARIQTEQERRRGQCTGCYYIGDGCNSPIDMPHCMRSFRKDNRTIIWVNPSSECSPILIKLQELAKIAENGYGYKDDPRLKDLGRLDEELDVSYGIPSTNNKITSMIADYLELARMIGYEEGKRQAEIDQAEMDAGEDL